MSSYPRIGVDMGGTRTRIAVFADPAGTRHAVVARFATDPDYDRQLAAVVDAVRAACPAPAAVGVSVAGRVSRDGSGVSVSLLLRRFQGRALRDDLADALSCPVRLAHDATCGLLGEHRYGCLAGEDRCAYLTLSTGTGCAVRLGAGARFVVMTTEAGHQLIAGNDLACDCGQRGCLETFTGGRTLERRLATSLADVDQPRFWQEYARSLAHGLANVALVAGVEAIALGGGIMVHRPEIWPWLRVALSERLTYQPLRVLAAQLGEDTPLVGAAALFDAPAGSILH